VPADLDSLALGTPKPVAAGHAETDRALADQSLVRPLCLVPHPMAVLGRKRM
jgi:hypothetical protein